LDVRILYFATLRQRAGNREERITLAEARPWRIKRRLGDHEVSGRHWTVLWWP
jgi:hypothetical protein